MTILQGNIEQPPAGTFTEATTTAALKMRKALVDMFGTLPVEIRRARDLEKALGLDHNLAWSLFQVISAPNILSVANRLPKVPSVRRIIKAGEKHGVPSEALEKLRLASARFEEVVKIHAKDHITFSSLVAGVSGTEEGAGSNLVARRGAFRYNTQLWGNQIDTAISMWITRVAPDGSGLQQAFVFARLGLKLFRPVAKAIPYPIGDAEKMIRPLDRAASERYGAYLLPEFCTQPLPRFRRQESEQFGPHFEFVADNVGQASSIDVAIGHIYTPLALEEAWQKRECGGDLRAGTPTAKMILDHVVHRPSLGVVQPIFECLGMHSEGPREELPVHPEIVKLSGGVETASPMEAPRYSEMLLYACGVLGWDPSEFDIYRAVIDYPILHSRNSFRFKF